jgi:hypothetical protein
MKKICTFGKPSNSLTIVQVGIIIFLNYLHRNNSRYGVFTNVTGHCSLKINAVREPVLGGGGYEFGFRRKSPTDDRLFCICQLLWRNHETTEIFVNQLIMDLKGTIFQLRNFEFNVPLNKRDKVTGE